MFSLQFDDEFLMVPIKIGSLKTLLEHHTDELVATYSYNVRSLDQIKITSELIFAEVAGTWSVYDYNFGGQAIEGVTIDQPFWFKPETI